MKLRIWKLALGLLVFLGVVITISEIWPEQTAKIMLSGLNASAGLTQNSTDISVGTISYLEGGKGEAIVFLHGIYALKEHWIDISKEVSDEYRVILLDLPGFGENPRLEMSEYDFKRQTENVLEAINAIGIEKFHLAANSMGAQIAGQLAVALPERVQSVAFIGSPVGIRSPIRSDMEHALVQGHAPLVVTTKKQYEERMPWLFPVTPFIPRPISRTWARAEISHADTNQRIWKAVNSSSVTPLEKLAPRLSQPSLIIWCREDRIFHVSGAEVLTKALQNSRMVIGERCGHLPMLDRAAKTGQEFLSFLKSLD